MMHNKQTPENWQSVKSIKLATAREMISLACYKRSLCKTLFWFLFDAMLFFLGMLLIFLSQHLIIKYIGAGLSGMATARLFVWAHDVAHGALFKNTKPAEIIGTIAMLPSLNMYRLWSYGHNKIHHGFAPLSPIDWIWRPLTPKEYRALSATQRFLYRIERNFFGCAFHYLRKVWWNEMVCFNPGKTDEKRRYFRHAKWFVIAYVIGISSLAYIFAGGIVGILCVVIIPFIVFNYLIALIVYLHHMHPDIPFFDVKKNWSHSIGVLYIAVRLFVALNWPSYCCIIS